MKALEFKSIRKGKAGFSLVELMIVVAIIGVLAALAVPRFQTFQAKAKQAEAKSNLSHIYTLEQAYFGDASTYTDTTGIGFATQGRVRYGYAAPTVSASAFTAWANATSTSVISSDCTVTDSWNINEAKALFVNKDCATNATGGTARQL